MFNRETSAYPDKWDPNYVHPTNVGELLSQSMKRAIAIDEAREAKREAEYEIERRMWVPVQRSVSPLQVLIDRVRDMKREKRGVIKRLLTWW